MQQTQAKDKVTFAGNVCRTAPDCASLILQVTVIVFQSVVLKLLVVQDSKQQEQQHMLRLSRAITTARLHRAVRLLWMPRLRRSACTPAHHLSMRALLSAFHFFDNIAVWELARLSFVLAAKLQGRSQYVM